MTVGRRQYNEGDMIQLAREAEDRVREMQNRVRKTVEEHNMGGGFAPPASHRNWSTNPNMPRTRSQIRSPQRPRANPPAEPVVEAEAKPVEEEGEPQAPQAPAEPAEKVVDAAPPAPPPAPPAAPPGKKDTTIVGDIMNALGLDDDYLLIVGLLLILINQRADTTLILALIYLLI